MCGTCTGMPNIIYIYNVTSVDFQTDIATEYIPYMLYFFFIPIIGHGLQMDEKYSNFFTCSQ